MTQPTYEVHHILVLSTIHITASDADLIAGEVYPGKGGDMESLFVYTGDASEKIDGTNPTDQGAITNGYSNALPLAMALARRLGCRYIVFDTDGPVVDELPTYES